MNQEKKKIAIQGVHGAFHEIAANHLFQDQKIEIVPAHTFEEVVKLTGSSESADYGLMAIENTIVGSLLNNYRLLHRSTLNVVGEVYLRISQNLLVFPGVMIEDLKEVHSHPIANAQCLEFFKQYPHIKLVAIEDTALAAQNIRSYSYKHIGAIASTLAAKNYDLNVLHADIETFKQNHTRFLLLSTQPNTSGNKISLSFTVKHETGSLVKVLTALAMAKANLTKIQSLPLLGTAWTYQFFIDLILEDASEFSDVLEALENTTNEYKILGRYEVGAHFKN